MKTTMLTDECKLLPGTRGVIIQGLLVIISFGLLVLKKRIEAKYSNRTWGEFLLDSSKQIIGAFWLHLFNLAIAVHQHKIHSDGDACDWYWINIVVDCTAGTAIEFALFLLIMKYLLPRYVSERTMRQLHSGEYGGQRLPEINWTYYFKQLSVWLVICSLMKVCVLIVMRLGGNELLALAKVVLSRYDKYPSRKLMIVMVVTPLLFSTVQLWIVDNILRKSERSDPSSIKLLN